MNKEMMMQWLLGMTQRDFEVSALILTEGMDTAIDEIERKVDDMERAYIEEESWVRSGEVFDALEEIRDMAHEIRKEANKWVLESQK